MVMRRIVPMIGFGASLVAASALIALAQPALAKASPDSTQAPKSWYRLGGNVEKHCGQRSFSISVGNPAFKNDIVYWPSPCG
jgi:hypothetical protein